ncbi:MAG: beta-galactosidase [Sedimentisphaerales bacterium]|nr:beta-galactosidase [Sedimentisphaerales bacterium]
MRKPTPLWTVLPAVLLCITAIDCAFGQAGRFIQDRFAIGLWVDPPADEKMDQRYQELAEANFTLVIGGFGANNKQTIQKQIQLCEKYDLRLLIKTTDAKPEDLLNSPVCWGINLHDEPSARDFGRLRTAVDKLRQTSPGKLTYINLFPNYAGNAQLGTDNYDQHVSRFVNEVEPDVLSMDHYPIMVPGADGRKGYCDNLEVMRTYSLQKKIPFWNFFNTMPYGPHYDPTEAQLRWQIYTSLAYGAKGVLYFCYYTPAGGEFPKGGAIITRDDRKTRHYYEAQRINRAIRNLGPTLMKLTSTRVYRIEPKDKPAAILKGSPIRQLTAGDYLVGEFVHEDGRKAVLLNNYDFAYSSWPTVTFEAPVESVLEIDPETSEARPVIDDSPAMEGLQISLDSGAGRLFIIQSN